MFVNNTGEIQSSSSLANFSLDSCKVQHVGALVV